MNRIIDQLEAEQMRQDLPHVEIGDTVRVHMRITEGEGKDRRTRIQVFEGVVLGRHGRGINDMLTVRRVTYGIGVERTFPVHMPNLEKIEVTRKGDVRRAKLYYLRDRVGKSAKVKERSRWAVQRGPKPVKPAPEAEAVAAEPEAPAKPARKTRGKAAKAAAPAPEPELLVAEAPAPEPLVEQTAEAAPSGSETKESAE
jgi:large subunit ribosomal protein L19